MLIELIRPFGRNTKAIEIDLHGDNPLLDYIVKAYGGSPYGGTPPEMFHSGPRPPFLASGESPDVLRRVRYELRHTAAMTESRSLLLACVEASTASALNVDPESMMSPEGRGQFNDYKSRVWTWATAGPEAQVSYTSEDFDKLFGPQVGGVR